MYDLDHLSGQNASVNRNLNVSISINSSFIEKYTLWTLGNYDVFQIIDRLVNAEDITKRQIIWYVKQL